MRYQLLNCFFILLLLVGCNDPELTPTDVFSTQTPSYQSPFVPTITPKDLTTPTNVTKIMLEKMDSISFDEYNSILAHEPLTASKRIAISPDGKLLAALGDLETYQRNIQGGIFIWDFGKSSESIKSFRAPFLNPTSGLSHLKT